MSSSEESVIYVSAETYDWLLAELEEPPRECPKLVELAKRASVFVTRTDEEGDHA